MYTLAYTACFLTRGEGFQNKKGGAMHPRRACCIPPAQAPKVPCDATEHKGVEAQHGGRAAAGRGEDISSSLIAHPLLDFPGSPFMPALSAPLAAHTRKRAQ